MDAVELYRRCTLGFLDRVDQVRDDQWQRPTPCPAWTVRDLVAHVVAEDRWAAPIMRGLTTEQVGDRFAGDLLGDDPVAAAHRAAAIATGAIEDEAARRATVHLAYGDEETDEFVRTLAVDHLLHGWDLAMATTGDPRLDPDLVAEVHAWFGEHEERYRAAGAIGPRRPMHGTALAVDLADHLLSVAGRDPEWGPNHVCLDRFVRALEGADPDALAMLLTDDCLLETAGPAPNGRRLQGVDAVVGELAERLTGIADPHLLHEEGFVCGDRATTRWRYSWLHPDGSRRHVRAAAVLTFRDGRIAEVLAYTKR